MITRIKKIIEVEGRSNGQFAEEIGISSSRLSHIFSGRNDATLEIITKILERYRGINPDWLLFGRGEMYRDGSRVQEQNNLFNSMTANTPTVSDFEDITTEEPENDTIESVQDVFESQIEIEDEKSAESVNLPKAQIESKKVSVGKKISKIVFFYDDMTFESYLPN